MTLYYGLTQQIETLRDPGDPESWQIEDLTVLEETTDPKTVRDFINTIETEDLYTYYLTVWSGDPEDWRSEILDQINLEYADQVNDNLRVILDNGDKA